jgi:hypothetical protein
MRGLGQRVRWSASVAGIATVLFASRAHAQDETELPVTVLKVQTLDAFDQAEGLTGALRRVAEDAPGWSAPPQKKEWALQVLTLSLSCEDPPDAACEQRIADEIKTDRFLWATMEKQGADVAGELHFWQRGIGGKATKYRYSANLKDASDDTLLQVVRERFAEVAGPPIGGRLNVVAGSIDATVLVDGKEIGSLRGGRGSFDVPLGLHRVELVATGYEAMETKINVAPRSTSDVALTPVAIEKGAPLTKIFGFTALGLGVGAAGAAGFAGVQMLTLNNDVSPYKTNDHKSGLYIPKGLDGCDPGPNRTFPNLVGGGTQAERDEFTAICDASGTYQVLQFALWPTAGVLGGVGATLLALSDWSEDEAESARVPVRIEPRFGAGSADVTVTVRF